MDAAVLYSGGKDSTMALYKAMEHDNVKYLVSMVSDNPYSYMFHVPNIRWTRLSSKAISIPLLEGPTTGIKEEELKDLKRILKVLRERESKYYTLVLLPPVTSARGLKSSARRLDSSQKRPYGTWTR